MAHRIALGTAFRHTTLISSTALVRGSSVAASAVAMAAGHSARNARVQATAQASPPPALTSARTAVVAIAPPVPSLIPASTPTKSTEKVNKTVNKTPSGPSLYDRVCTNRNLEIGSIVIGSAAVAAAFGVWASQVGTIAASQIVAANTVAFFQPGVTIFAFALKTGMFITVNTVVPVATGLITISLPVIATVAATAIGGFIILYVVNKMIQKLEAGVKSGLTTMKDTVTGLPGMLLRQVPGYSLVSSMFGSAENEPPVTKAARRKRSPVTNSGDAPRSIGLAAHLDPIAHMPGMYTRLDFLRAKAARQAKGEVA